MALETNVLYYGDNLDVLRKHIPDECVDLIYLDPPFNSSRSYNVLFRESTGAGSEAQLEAFEDTWHWGPAAQKAFEDVRVGQNQNVARMLEAMVAALRHNDVTAYLTMMAIRLIELHRVLKQTGSIYLHCDPTAGDYLKVLMDSVFRPKNFRNQIVWQRTSAHSDTAQGMKRFGRIHDLLLLYGKSDNSVWSPQFSPYSEDHLRTTYRFVDERGRRFSTADLTANKPGGDTSYEITAPDGTKVKPYKGRYWAYSRDNFEQFIREDRIFWRKTGMPRLKIYAEEMPGVPLQDLWTDIYPVTAGAKERLGYPTQKPLALLERIINVSSNPGDIVLDPFCGCGTAVHAAHKLKRRWIGIDITPLATGLIRRRMHAAFPRTQIEVNGEPKDLTGARELAATKPNHFEYWAVLSVDGQPTGGKGPDLDGVIPLTEFGGRTTRAVISVKGTKTVSPEMIRELRGAMNDDKPIGVLITLTPPTKGMITQAAAAGFYESADRKYPCIQILTIEEILAGKQPELLPQRSPFAEAPREREKAKTERML